MRFDDLVIIARVSHPIPFRTRTLNLLAPMVLCLKARESRSLPDLQTALFPFLFIVVYMKKPCYPKDNKVFLCLKKAFLHPLISFYALKKMPLSAKSIREDAFTRRQRLNRPLYAFFKISVKRLEQIAKLVIGN